MRRIHIIILCLLCILLINSCTNQAPTDVSNDQEVVTEQDQKHVETEPTQETELETDKSQQKNLETTPGTKNLTITITDRDGSTRDEVLTTEAQDLLTALKSSGLGSDAADTPGYIVTVGGRTADPAQSEWWQISKDGAPMSTSADQTPIKDGDHYVFTLNGPE